MVQHMMQVMPPEAVKIVMALLLSFLIGLEREEHKIGPSQYAFGGVRTFPLIGLVGFALAELAGSQLVPVTVGFAVVGAFLWLSYQHKLQKLEVAGATTEISGLATYLVGALVAREQFWLAAALTVISLLLLELKTFLESLSKRLPEQEIFTFTKFLLLSVVILPIVPNQVYGPFGFNPFKTWLVVVAVSAVSYASYLLQLRTTGKSGILLAAILGGMYSSTVLTVVFAKRARDEHRPHLFSGSILIASSVMYFRVLILVALFNMELTRKLLVPFLVLAVIGMVAGWIWTTRPDGENEAVKSESVSANPLELSSAFLFAVIFVVFLALTHYAVVYLGSAGVYGLAALTGFTDVTPLILGLASTAGASTPLLMAAAAIVIASASNNVIKAGYAYSFADRKTGMQSLALLLVYSILGVLPLIWLRG
ncbi:MAG: MgtC/SapB family protein [Candidatus Acidiferrales bacterium]